MGSTRPRDLVFDAGALIGLEKGDDRVRAILELALGHDVTVVVPVGALAQVWRDGSRQARLSRFLRDRRVVCLPLDVETSRACGVLCGRSGTSDVVDASIVIAALRRDAVIVTSDPADMRRLAPNVLTASL